MGFCAFVGDELSGLGFRLAGVECFSPGPGEVQGLFESLAARFELILITAQAAAGLRPESLRRVQSAGRPLLLVIADVRRAQVPPDRARAVRRQLGMGE